MKLGNPFKKKKTANLENPDCKKLLDMAKAMNTHREKCMQNTTNQKLKMECNMMDNFLKMLE